MARITCRYLLSLFGLMIPIVSDHFTWLFPLFDDSTRWLPLFLIISPYDYHCPRSFYPMTPIVSNDSTTPSCRYRVYMPVHTDLYCIELLRTVTSVCVVNINKTILVDSLPPCLFHYLPVRVPDSFSFSLVFVCSETVSNLYKAILQLPFLLCFPTWKIGWTFHII